MWYRSPLADLFSSLSQGMNIQMLGNMNGGMQNMFLVLERWRRIGGCESGSSFRKGALFYMLTAVYHYYTINIRDVIDTSMSISYIYIPIISLYLCLGIPLLCHQYIHIQAEIRLRQWQAVAGQGQQQCGGCQPCVGPSRSGGWDAAGQPFSDVNVGL